MAGAAGRARTAQQDHEQRLGAGDDPPALLGPWGTPLAWHIGVSLPDALSTLPVDNAPVIGRLASAAASSLIVLDPCFPMHECVAGEPAVIALPVHACTHVRPVNKLLL
jgi:hypothetical protein